MLQGTRGFSWAAAAPAQIKAARARPMASDLVPSMINLRFSREILGEGAGFSGTSLLSGGRRRAAAPGGVG
jgi:hypothetical protein